jgi:hypothetical protein
MASSAFPHQLDIRTRFQVSLSALLSRLLFQFSDILDVPQPQLRLGFGRLRLLHQPTHPCRLLTLASLLILAFLRRLQNGAASRPSAMMSLVLCRLTYTGRFLFLVGHIPVAVFRFFGGGGVAAAPIGSSVATSDLNSRLDHLIPFCAAWMNSVSHRLL